MFRSIASASRARLCFSAVLLMASNAAAQIQAASQSVRRPDSRQIRTSVAKLLGWQIGLPAAHFPELSLFELAVKTDAIGLGYIEGYSGQRLSAQNPKTLDDNLPAEDLAEVRNELVSLRLKLPAYDVDRFPQNGDGQRRLFQFAKELGVETIVACPDPASLAEIDRLAGEFGVNLAIDSSRAEYPAYTDPKRLMSLLEGRSTRMGVSADMNFWARHFSANQGIKPLEAQNLLNERLMVLHLSAASSTVESLLLQMSRALPPPVEKPDACSNCSRPVEKMKPVLLTVGTTGESFEQLQQTIASLEQAVRPAMGYRVEQIARILPTTSVDRVPADERQKMEAALPRKAIRKPEKPRKLLVIDLCPDGGYYHATIANANLALELMSENTGAYKTVFSNDLDNLKYPNIKQFDAVFLNSTVGEVFPDPEVLDGLMRFVREGGGLAGLHGASYASMDLPEFGELIGAQDGPHHVETATLKVDDPNSPLTHALEGKDFVYTDEFYHFLPSGPYSREKLHILISIDTAKSDMSKWHVRPDNDYGLAWIKSYGKGRVFNCALGHTPTLFENPALAEFILAGIQFVLGDLPANTTPSAMLTTRANR